uniref:Uncharacterized protein n=1 Tax=Panagrolaimus superbus TaxID=310955 RepID=A0A914Y319_9BILA
MPGNRFTPGPGLTVNGPNSVFPACNSYSYTITCTAPGFTNLLVTIQMMFPPVIRPISLTFACDAATQQYLDPITMMPISEVQCYM